ncbi:MAG TPA: hypothetical protein VE398_03180 [Acidobacteriota bacterium]|nr:hypothetical protein [Acidobacteriota bacterium]
MKHLGYFPSALIRVYGQQFEVISDPFPEEGGVVIRVKTKTGKIRTLKVPVTILQVAGGAPRDQAA